MNLLEGALNRYWYLSRDNLVILSQLIRFVIETFGGLIQESNICLLYSLDGSFKAGMY
jgi:hypothetical protein